MAIDHLEKAAASPRPATIGSPEHRTATSDEGTETKLQLRDSLACENALIRQIDALIQQHQEVADKLFAGRKDAAGRIASLSPRRRQIMQLILAGHHSKNIAADLGISQRTVENHRAVIMKKTGTKVLRSWPGWRSPLPGMGTWSRSKLGTIGRPARCGSDELTS